MNEQAYTRLLPLDGAYNVRDLGGYKTVDNKHVKWRTLFRSGDLNKLTDTDLKYLSEIPIKTYIDFRGRKERDMAPDKLAPGIVNDIQLPISAGDMSDMIHLTDFKRVPEAIKQAYKNIINNSQPVYTEFFHIVSENTSAPLLFHCSAGKDRTGIAAALLLSALGVDRKTIMQDYMLSAEYIKGKYDFLIKARPALAPITTVEPEYLQTAFDLIDNEYGGVHNFLTKNLKANILKIRELYTE